MPDDLTPDPDETELSGVAWARLSKDLRKAAEALTVAEARFLVDAYYQVQQFRIEAAGQARAAVAAGEPAEFTGWIGRVMKTLEGAIVSALDRYTETRTEGRWAKSLVGIGPVLSAGLLAHIDITKAATAGAIWRFAGLDPTSTWAKETKRPWNARLKVLCWKIGESFIKQQSHPDDVYGRVYVERKAFERARNESGALGDQAAAALAAKRYRKETRAKVAYEAGRLPDAHIHARARRYAVKLFLAHYHHVAYEVATGSPPPRPYIIEHGGHTHFIAPPNWPMTE